MPEMSAIDRADFQKRLATYGLDENSLLMPEFSTVQSSVSKFRFGGDSRFQPVVLKTADFDVVNRWIGLPDGVFQQIDPIFELPKSSKVERFARTSRSEAVAFENVARGGVSAEPAASHVVVRDLARAYLYGDSAKARPYKALIEKTFPAVAVAVWPFMNIVVRSGSVLEFGPGPHVLVAHSLTIERGGVVRSLGSLKVDANIVQKTATKDTLTLNSALSVASVVR
jgi:hypothetical protein